MTFTGMVAPVYDFSDTTLANGLRVVINEDHAVPVVAVNLWYDVGSRHEEPGRTGLAHLFEHLMFEGSAHVSKGEHLKLLQAVGASLNATTWGDRTNYFETVPSHHLELALWLEADRMGGLGEALSQETLDNQRAVVQNERRQSYDNQPYGDWLERLQQLGFPEGHPYQHSTIGSMDDLEAASLGDVKEFYRRHYAPNNAVLTLVGDVDTAAALALVERYFGGIAACQDLVGPPDGSAPASIGGEIRRTIPDNVPLPAVFIGYRCPPFGTPDFDALSVLSVVLGGGRGSRLYHDLVLEQQLVRPSEEFVGALDFVGGATLLIADLHCAEGVHPETAETAYDAVLDTLLRDGVGPAEMERAQALLTSELLGHLSALDGRADAFSQHATLFGDPGLVNTRLDRLLAVTAADVVRVGRAVMSKDNRVVLTYVPDEAAGESTADSGLVDAADRAEVPA
ncbi:MAG TPA: pitrilysin family protein [Mycobacteriales bacterium]|nr:pitrilysin family protein [Mycobacteriales bacterium]